VEHALEILVYSRVLLYEPSWLNVERTVDSSSSCHQVPTSRRAKSPSLFRGGGGGSGTAGAGSHADSFVAGSLRRVINRLREPGVDVNPAGRCVADAPQMQIASVSALCW